MPEAAGQQPAQGAGVGVWLNRIFLGLCLYVLVFGNPLKSMLPDVTNTIIQPTGNASSPFSAPQVPTPTTRSGKHQPMLLPGAKLVRR